MKVCDILLEDVSYRIFCDLDGVLVNFAQAAMELTGINPDANKMDYDKELVNRFWLIIRKHMKEGKPFFSTMQPTPDAHVLWNYLRKYEPTILSSTGRSIPGIEQQKMEWVSRHLGSKAAADALFVQSASLKAQYAAPTHILIDDRAKAIDPWVAAGGVGILHTSAADTITRLKQLGV